jgi:hypothetical protein
MLIAARRSTPFTMCGARPHRNRARNAVGGVKRTDHGPAMMNHHIRLDKGDSIYNRNPAGAKDFKGFGNMARSGR